MYVLCRLVPPVHVVVYGSVRFSVYVQWCTVMSVVIKWLLCSANTSFFQCLYSVRCGIHKIRQWNYELRRQEEEEAFIY